VARGGKWIVSDVIFSSWKGLGGRTDPHPRKKKFSEHGGRKSCSIEADGEVDPHLLTENFRGEIPSKKASLPKEDGHPHVPKVHGSHGKKRRGGGAMCFVLRKKMWGGHALRGAAPLQTKGGCLHHGQKGERLVRSCHRNVQRGEKWEQWGALCDALSMEGLWGKG